MERQSFFDLKCYNNLRKVVERLKERHTLRNFILYYKWLLKCQEIAEGNFDDIGFDPKKMSYRWVDSLGTDFAPEEYTYQECRDLLKQFGDDLDAMISHLVTK